MRGRSRSARGQTLIEVLVAVVILGVGLVSVMQAFSVCSNAAARISAETVAREYAARLLAEIRANPALMTSDEEGDLGADHPGFTWRRELRETGERGVLAVRVTVRWRLRGIDMEYVLLSLVGAPRAQG